MTIEELDPEVREAVATMPTRWQAQVLVNSKNWRSGGGWPAATIEVEPDAAYAVGSTIIFPPRVGLRCLLRNTRSQWATLSGTFLDKPLLRTKRAPGNDSTGDGNFNLLVEGISLECAGRTNGAQIHAAQQSQFILNRIQNPKDYGVRIMRGSVAFNLSGNDIDGGRGKSGAVGYLFEPGCRAIFANGGTIVEIAQAIDFTEGCRSIGFRDMFIENISGTALNFGNRVHGCSVNGAFELLHGPVARFHGGSAKYSWLNKVSGTIRKTKDPHWIDRDGKKRGLWENYPEKAARWYEEQAEGELGWSFEIDA